MTAEQFQSGASGRRRKSLASFVRLAGLGLLLIVAISVPMWAGNYMLNVLIVFAINALLVLGYRSITAMGGWSFAHVAIMGLGGYTFAVLTQKHIAWPAWAAVGAAVALAAVVAMLIAVPVLRTRSFYFFLSTFAAGEALRQAFIQFPAITGGNQGIAFIVRPEIAGLSFENDSLFYLLVVGLVVATGVGLYHLDRSRFGATIAAVRLNEALSKSLGINAYGYRISAFVLGSAISAVAGIVFASFNGIINPSDFGTEIMFKVIAACIIGGVSTLWGPLLGLAYLTLIEEVFRNFQAWIPLIWGVNVILVLLFSPSGLEGLAGRFAAWLRLKPKVV